MLEISSNEGRGSRVEGRGKVTGKRSKLTPLFPRPLHLSTTLDPRPSTLDPLSGAPTPRRRVSAPCAGCRSTAAARIVRAVVYATGTHDRSRSPGPGFAG